MSDTLTIRSFRDMQSYSEHVVAVSHTKQHTMEIRELRNSMHQPDSLATCFLELQPRNYLHVDLQIRRGDQRSRVMIAVDNSERTLTMEHNEVVTQQIHLNHDPILLDGPSPMFDWANAIMLLGMCDGESYTLPVYVIDANSGKFSEQPYSFYRYGQRITIQKGIDSLADSELVLSSDSYEIDVYYSGGYRFQNTEEG